MRTLKCRSLLLQLILGHGVNSQFGQLDIPQTHNIDYIDNNGNNNREGNSTVQLVCIGAILGVLANK